MIRVYLDWNVYSRLGHNTQIHKKLGEILQDDTKYIIPYSHAHVMDLHRSYLKRGFEGINGHLAKIEKYSKSIFITDTRYDKLEYQLLQPIEAMKQYIDAHQEINFSNFNLNDIPSFELLKPLFDIQIPNLVAPKNGGNDTYFKELKNQSPRTLKEAQKLLGTGETTSMGIIMENLLKLSSTFLQDDSYARMRDAYQKDLKINTGRLTNKNFNPKDILDHTAQKVGHDDFLGFHERLLSGNKDKSQFKRIIELCHHLDMNGFYSETITPSHHLDNATTDYNHIGYASTCDIFIIEDKDTREKAILAFELLNLHIKVYKPDEFVAYIQNNDTAIEHGSDLTNYLFWVAANEPMKIENGLHINYLNSYVLDYFNLIINPADNPKQVYLSKYTSGETKFVLKKEFLAVRKKLLNLFGEPQQECNDEENNFYSLAWLTNDLVLVQFKLRSDSIMLDIQQCRKMSTFEKFWKKCLTTLKII